MNVPKYNILFVSIGWSEMLSLIKMYSTHDYIQKYKIYKSETENLGLELLGIYCLDSSFPNPSNNLKYYEDDYTETYIKQNYSIEFNDMISIYKEKFINRKQKPVAIAIYASKKKFNFIHTYKIYEYLQKSGFLYNIEELKFEQIDIIYEKNLLDIKEFDNILFMDYNTD